MGIHGQRGGSFFLSLLFYLYFARTPASEYNSRKILPEGKYYRENYRSSQNFGRKERRKFPPERAIPTHTPQVS